jgi:hypothetical protein
MKRAGIVFVSLAFLVVVVMVWAQSFTPPPIGAYIKPTAGGTWTPATTTSTSGGQGSFVPPPQGLYCKNNSTNQWVPCISLGTTDANGNTGLPGQLPVANGTGGFIWTTLPAAITPNNAQLQFSTGAATVMTAGSVMFFANGVAAGMTAGPLLVSYGVRTSFAGTAKNMQLAMSSVVAAGNSLTFTAAKNGVTQALSCTMGVGATQCSDNNAADGFAVNQGDAIVISAICTGTCGTNSAWAMQGTVQVQ